MLAREGLSGFSIPALAEELGFTRRSIYLFFPTPYAVLNELTHRYIKKLEQHLEQAIQSRPPADAIQAIAHTTFAAADFHNANPVARLLILGGAVSDRSYRAQESNIRQLGILAGKLLESLGYQLPPSPPDIPTLAIELGTACFRFSQYQHDCITDTYKVEASHVMLLYLQQLLELSSTPSREALQELLACHHNSAV